VEQAEAVGTQEEVLSRRVAHALGRRWLRAAGADVLEGDVEPGLLCLAAVNGGGDEDVSLLTIHVP